MTKICKRHLIERIEHKTDFLYSNNALQLWVVIEHKPKDVFSIDGSRSAQDLTAGTSSGSNDKELRGKKRAGSFEADPISWSWLISLH